MDTKTPRVAQTPARKALDTARSADTAHSADTAPQALQPNRTAQAEGEMVKIEEPGVELEGGKGQ